MMAGLKSLDGPQRGWPELTVHGYTQALLHLPDARADRHRGVSGLTLHGPVNRSLYGLGCVGGGVVTGNSAASARRIGPAATPSAARVAGPTMPSTTRWWLAWKALTAPSVSGPNAPSALTPSRCWT